MNKRSSNLRLTLMAATAPTMLLLGGCEEPTPTGQVLQGESQCDAQTDVAPAECHAAYRKALDEHQRVAPRFANQGECSDQFGNCAPVADTQGQTHWIPPMTGFLLGYLASDLMNSRGGYRTVAGSSPLYRDYRSGDFLRPTGDPVGRRTGQVTGDFGKATVPARAVTVSRAGFGSSSAARSSFSSSRGLGGGFGG
jgi:uncharacterized protein YgiB involved in biofilm formation